MKATKQVRALQSNLISTCERIIAPIPSPKGPDGVEEWIVECCRNIQRKTLELSNTRRARIVRIIARIIEEMAANAKLLDESALRDAIDLSSAMATYANTLKTLGNGSEKETEEVTEPAPQEYRSKLSEDITF